MKTAVVIFFAVIALTSAAVDLPKSLKPCKRSTPKYAECLVDSAITFIRAIGPTGLPAWKIPAVEPLSVNSVKISGTNGPVSLSQEFYDVKLHGLTKGLQVSNYRVDWDKLVIHWENLNPQVEFVARYKIDGKVLVLPVQGHGPMNITMFNLHSVDKIQLQKFEKNGETYLKAIKYDTEFNPEKVLMYFENLFNGDKTLGDQMNKFLNENSALIFNELKPDYEEAFGQVFLKITNGVFTNVPFSQLTPP